jgi:cleavage and polyadenylation specificity factor subunit 2
MSDSVMNAFNAARQNPFQLKCVHLCKDLERLAQLPSPKVVMASMPDLESGFSRQLFLEYASNKENLILFVDKPNANSLGRSVYDSENKESVRKFEVEVSV